MAGEVATPIPEVGAAGATRRLAAVRPGDEFAVEGSSNGDPVATIPFADRTGDILI
jgi:hypothetical protein